MGRNDDIFLVARTVMMFDFIFIILNDVFGRVFCSYNTQKQVTSFLAKGDLDSRIMIHESQVCASARVRLDDRSIERVACCV